MDPFVRRLVQRLLEPGQPLSRNRHFHTFDTPEGRRALKIFRRLRSLERDILASQRDGGTVRICRQAQQENGVKVEIHMERVFGRRMALMEEDEFNLLAQLPAVRRVLEDLETAA